MKYRITKNNDEINVILEDGGIACIRDAEEVNPGDRRQSTTDYYQDRFNQEMLDRGDIWEKLGEGNMYYNDWITPFDDPKHIQDALEWLCINCNEGFELDETIWKGEF